MGERERERWEIEHSSIYMGNEGRGEVPRARGTCSGTGSHVCAKCSSHRLHRSEGLPSIPSHVVPSLPLPSPSS